MARVFLSLGSNIEQQRYITAALDALAGQFGQLLISSVYESVSVGFDGDNFYNLVVGIDTELSVSELSVYLKALEDQNGRRRDCPRFSARTLDIDILTYDKLVGTVDGILLPRQEILENAFVLWPLAELVPEEKHPVIEMDYGELWRTYDQASQSLWPVSFTWQGVELSRLSSTQLSDNPVRGR
ncbi:MAG: 2-amino-4-hydroxy-6-hydroxymethyldihydropteridine diphosphokinase [Porticoccus sp.]